MKLKNLEFLVLAILAIIVTVVACAQKKKSNLAPTKDQAQMLSAAHSELKNDGLIIFCRCKAYSMPAASRATASLIGGVASYASSDYHWNQVERHRHRGRSQPYEAFYDDPYC